MESFLPLLESGLGHMTCSGPLGTNDLKKQRLEKHVYMGACPAPSCWRPRDHHVKRPWLASWRMRGPATPAEVPVM